MTETTSQIYFPDTKAQAVFAADGPKPRFLIDAPMFKALVVGLEAGAQIPVHPEGPSMFHFLEGEGLMTVGDETFAVKPGVTIVVPENERRGMNAKTRLIFLASRSG